MSQLIQVLLLILAIQCLGVSSRAFFEGISFSKGFELNFKPLPFKPITFIKEKLTPFGKFTIKHAIQKRSLNTAIVPSGPVSAAPVIEHVEEDQILHQPPLIFVPTHIPPPIPTEPAKPPSMPPILLAPIVSTHKPPVISSPPPPPYDVLITPVPKPKVEAVPYFPVPAVLEKTEATNMVIPPPVKVEKSEVPPPGLLTDISRSEPVKEFIEAGQPPVPVVEEKALPPIEKSAVGNEMPKSDIVLPEFLVRGSKIALFFGNVFAQLLSQLLTNARATFDQITNPPPVFSA